MITLTKLKLAGGNETPRFEATVCWHGKAVGVAANGGTGGASRVLWTAAETTKETVLREAGRVAKTWEPHLFSALDPMAPSSMRNDALDFVLMHEIEILGHARALDRACKTHTVVRLHGAKPGQFWRVRGATPADLARERSKPDVAVVLNDLSSRERAERLMRAEPPVPVLSTHP